MRTHTETAAWQPLPPDSLQRCYAAYDMKYAPRGGLSAADVGEYIRRAGLAEVCVYGCEYVWVGGWVSRECG